MSSVQHKHQSHPLNHWARAFASIRLQLLISLPSKEKEQTVAKVASETERKALQPILKLTLNKVLAMTFDELVPGCLREARAESLCAFLDRLRREIKPAPQVKRSAWPASKPAAEPAKYKHAWKLRFEKVSRNLLKRLPQDDLSVTLATYTLPQDRCLPRALLEQPLSTVLQTPFSTITAMPWMGSTRIAGLVGVLERITPKHNLRAGSRTAATPSSPDASLVIDVWPPQTWEAARQTIRQLSLQDEPVGRYARSLQLVPKAYWRAPFGQFAKFTLPEFRERPAFGPEKVKQIAQVFADLYHALSSLPPGMSPAERMLPRNLRTVETFCNAVSQNWAIVNRESMTREILEPFLRQIAIDAGDSIVELGRARIESNVTLNTLAAPAGLTRERIRQQISEISEILNLRWPEGKLLLLQLHEQAQRFAVPSDIHWLARIIKVLYGEKIRKANREGPLPRALTLSSPYSLSSSHT